MVYEAQKEATKKCFVRDHHFLLSVSILVSGLLDSSKDEEERRFTEGKALDWHLSERVATHKKILLLTPVGSTRSS